MSMRVWLALLATLTLLTVGPGATAGTSNTPTNGLIAARGADGIYLVTAQGAKAWKVPGTLNMGSPTWSPDGSLLAVDGWDESGNNVYTVKPDGTDLRLVLRNASSPSWSPDGKRLAVIREGCLAPYTCDTDFQSGGGILVTVRADGSDVQQVDNGKDLDGDGEPAWSPDGKWIAFFGGNGAVNLVSPNGADDGFRALTQSGSGGSWNLAWSPDASKLAVDTFDKAHAYRQEITVFDFATERWTIVPSRRPISSLAWSPDGKQLAFLSSRPMPESSSGHCGGEMPMDLWGMGVDGSNPHRLSKGSYGHPSWGTFRPEPTPSIGPKSGASLSTPGTATMANTDWSPNGRLLGVDTGSATSASSAPDSILKLS